MFLSWIRDLLEDPLSLVHGETRGLEQDQEKKMLRCTQNKLQYTLSLSFRLRCPKGITPYKMKLELSSLEAATLRNQTSTPQPVYPCAKPARLFLA